MPLHHIIPLNANRYQLPKPFTGAAPNNFLPATGGTTSILFPGDSTGGLKAVRLHLVDKNKVLTAPTLTSPEEFQALAQSKSYIVAFGEVFYLDVFGVTHWTRFCKVQELNGRLTNLSTACANFDAVDDNYK